MADDDKPRRRGRMMTSDDRALVGERRRREERTSPRGIPVLADEYGDEDTDPRDLLRRDPTDEDIELAHQLGRDLREPLTILDFAKFLRGERRRHEEHRSGNRELDGRLVELLKHPPNEATAELQRDMNDARRGIRIAKRIAIVAISGALAALGGWADKLWSRAASEGAANIRLERVERDLLELRQDLREDRSRRNQP